MGQEFISVRGARAHNLKNVSVDIPKNKFVVITGLSGSGKSSLAFDTIYAEGQRRYMESLSSYARQFLELQDKPDVDEILGLSPTIAIDQKSSSHNPRSTVGTVTEIYDFLRVLFARAGVPHCPKCGDAVSEQTLDQISARLQSSVTTNAIILLLAPVVQNQKGEHKQVLVAAMNAGFSRVRFDGLLMDIEEAIAMKKDKKKDHTVEIVVAEIDAKKTPMAIKDCAKKALEYGNGNLIALNDDNGDETSFSQSFSCARCGTTLPKPEPRLFSFNSPFGACVDCTGLGIKLVLESDLVIPNRRLTFAEGAVRPWTRIAGNQTSYLRLLETVGKKHKFSIGVPVEKIAKDKLDLILNGTGDDVYAFDGGEVTFPGVLAQLEAKYKETDSEYVRHELEGYMRTMPCPGCGGRRLKPEVLAVRIGDKNISDVVNMAMEDVLAFFEPYVLKRSKDGAKIEKKKDKKDDGKNFGDLSPEAGMIVERVAKEIVARLTQLMDVGVGYLTLDRAAMTLSGGEAQRVRLATQLGSSLSGVIYILDEPSIGLHPRDNDRLIETMKKLRDVGNSVIVVEHDQAVIEAADYVFDVGPGAGEYGGEIIAEGTPAQILKDKDSLTGQYLSGKKEIALPKAYRKGSGKKLTIVGANAFNLKNLDVEIPLGKLVCVTGVSGSGKSTLIYDILYKRLAQVFYRAKERPGAHGTITGLEHIDKVINIDQSPIGRTPRSNPATYTGAFTPIRDLLASVPEARMRGYAPGRFSFNVKGGRCEACHGEGFVEIEMHFLPNIEVPCEVCKGKRYNREALEIYFKGKNIAEILDMTIEEAADFFDVFPAIKNKFATLNDVGLSYMRLGQPATTLSGGEAQRVKLATELSRRSTGRTLYILDEPTTGLSFEDVAALLRVIQRLVDTGNTVVLIEHHLDMIKNADWLIDLGPGGGHHGGEILATGTPEEIALLDNSFTGQYLRPILGDRVAAATPARKRGRRAS